MIGNGMVKFSQTIDKYFFALLDINLELRYNIYSCTGQLVVKGVLLFNPPYRRFVMKGIKISSRLKKAYESAKNYTEAFSSVNSLLSSLIRFISDEELRNTIEDLQGDMWLESLNMKSFYRLGAERPLHRKKAKEAYETIIELLEANDM